MKFRTSGWLGAATAGRRIAGGLLGAWLVAGCGGGGATETIGGATPSWGEEETHVPLSATARVLRERFPGQAALVLEQGNGFVSTEAGFAPDTRSGQGDWQSVEVTLPRNGLDAIRIRGFNGAEVRVREIGAEGEGALAERAVAYPRAGGTSFWMAVPGGVEEWLHLDAGAVRAEEPEAAWEVEGATVRQRGEAVEVVDASGVVLFSVTAPRAYAEGGREIGVRLVGSGATIALEVDAAEEAVLVDPLWVFAAPMIQARYAHAAALLDNGKVLVASGIGASTYPLATAEVYDPMVNAWTATGAMNQARRSHTATALWNGTALVAGGQVPGSYSGTTLAHAELYDPATNTWTAVGTMSQARYDHTATLLGNGKVLAAGGIGVSGTALASAELYDPATNTWSPAAAMSQIRIDHAALLLGSGKVLVTGGRGASGVTLASAEVYNPATNTWSPAAAMSQARYDHSATLLGNGRAMVVSGNNGGPLLISEQYNEASNTWSTALAVNQGRYNHTATLLEDGRLLVGGGFNAAPVATVEIYSTAAALGSACMQTADCASGFCVDGVCCDAACDAGTCDACSVAAGAAVNGTCSLLTGKACDDGNGCTQGDTCQAGACSAGAPVTCAAPDQCHTAGVCNPATGMCTNPEKANGTACDDGNACTQVDACMVGVCTGYVPVVCQAVDACHAAGVCGTATGVCPNPSKPDGTVCPGGTCNAGVCVAKLSQGENSVSADISAPIQGGGFGCSMGGTSGRTPAWLGLGLGLLLAIRRRRRGFLS